MTGTGGPDVDLLTQGVLWVEANTFQIIRMRNDLLFPGKQLRRDELTTQVKFR